MSKKQDSSAVYNILAFIFDGKKGADNVMKELKSSGALDGYKIQAECIVEQDEKGKVHMHEPHHGTAGTAIGTGSGALLGLIGGPAGLLAWTLAGGVIGGVAGQYLGRAVSKGEMKEIGEALTPDSSAMLVLLEDKDSEKVIKSMAGYSANVITLTVGDELSGQIAAYAAGAASDPAGDVVAGEAGAAASGSDS